jgi:hypothetical protein
MDTNGDGSVDISDAVFHLSYLFQGGPAPHCVAQGRSPIIDIDVLRSDVDVLLEAREFAGTYVYRGVWLPSGANWESVITIGADGTIHHAPGLAVNPALQGPELSRLMGAWKRDPQNPNVLLVTLAGLTGVTSWGLTEGTFTFVPTRVGFTANLVSRACPAGVLPCPGPCDDQPGGWTMNACRLEP